MFTFFTMVLSTNTATASITRAMKQMVFPKTMQQLAVVLLLLATIFSSTVLCLAYETNGTSKDTAISFTLELIHRDSPMSPYYDPSATLKERLRSAAFRSISRRRHGGRKTIGPTVTTLTEGDRNYLIPISFGTPPVKYHLTADTGSDLIWTQCSTCDQCYEQAAPLFVPSKSSTYGAFLCDAQPCQLLPLYACLKKTRPENLCGYYYTYGDKSITAGILSLETVTLVSVDGKRHAFPNTAFGCGHIDQGRYTNLTNGLVGLGHGPLSFVSQHGDQIDNRFSYCLTPLDSNETSKITFGAKTIASQKGTISTPLSLQTEPTFYYLTLEAIVVAGKAIPVPVSGTRGNIVIDSGTTLTYIDAVAYQKVEAAVKSSLRGQKLTPTKDDVFRLCYEENIKKVKVPQVALRFKGGDVPLKTSNVFYYPPDGTDGFCLALTPSDDGDTPILGDLIQVDFVVEYDLKKKLVSFAPAHCARL